MPRAWFFPLLLFPALLAGCESLGKTKVENPVFSEPPPRRSDLQQSASTNSNTADRDFSAFPNIETPEASAILPAKATQSPAGNAGGELEGSEIVARVNGRPIFASEILERYGPQLAEARQKASPEQFQQLRLSLLKRDLSGHVDRKLLVDALMETLKPEQVDAVQKHLDEAFEGEADRMKEQLKVGSKRELELELAKQGTSLESLRNAFANQQLARQYLAVKVKTDTKIGRRELFDYYQAHADEFAVPGAVKWRQIVILRKGPGGEQAAAEKLQQLIGQLRRNADFGEMARKFSDGPSADKGGDWGDWMQAGTLADKEMERALFELPVGTISDIYERDDAYYLVQPTERRESGRVPFADVQDKIQESLELEQRKEGIQKILSELREQAVIWTIFDEQRSTASTAKVDDVALR